MKNYRTQNLASQAGQTLIETMVAAFVLVMGISSAVGLAVYAFGVSSTTAKQIVAIGLAREGVEAVKNMRDTNWLQTPMSTDCYDFYTNGVQYANCYRDWLIGDPKGAGHNLEPAGGKDTYALGIDMANLDTYWQLFPTSDSFGLNYDDKGANGYYYTSSPGQTVSKSSSDYARMITIETDDSFAPFDRSDLGPRVKVTVDVWWTDKRCPVTDTVPTVNSCKVTLETYLTNWKNYSIIP